MSCVINVVSSICFVTGKKKGMKLLKNKKNRKRKQLCHMYVCLYSARFYNCFIFSYKLRHRELKTSHLPIWLINSFGFTNKLQKQVYLYGELDRFPGSYTKSVRVQIIISVDRCDEKWSGQVSSAQLDLNHGL